MGRSAAPASVYRGFGTFDGEDIFTSLADCDRRHLLGVLYDHAPASLSRLTLAMALVSQVRNNAEPLVSQTAVREARIRLHHYHLPKLAAAGLIEQDSARETVWIADHPAFEDTGIIAIISGESSADADSLDALFDALAHYRRRTILDVLSHQLGPIHVETVAREIAATEQCTIPSEVPLADVRQILASLEHIHLPVLSDAALIAYDEDEGAVAYEGHPDLRVPWMHSVLEPNFRASLTGEFEPARIGTITGRENVVSFGQSLCESADDELFCMFTDTHLLEAGCLTRLRDAARRGVAVYLGTRDATIQEFVRRNAPEVVLWEPAMDWVTYPVGETNVGRLLLADREAVMLGTLGAATEDGCAEERAIIGEGTDNELVVMVTQLLHAALDQSGDGPADIESELPF